MVHSKSSMAINQERKNLFLLMSHLKVFLVAGGINGVNGMRYSINGGEI